MSEIGQAARGMRDDEPLMIAWEKYRATDGAENSDKWARTLAVSEPMQGQIIVGHPHLVGSLWAAFMAGWIAALAGIAIPLLVSAALLTTVYFVGFRKGKGGIEPQPVKIVASHSWDQHELHERARTWLGSQMAEGKLRVDTAFLFGSILHEHYATSDVDVIVRFREMSERKIASAARKIKGSIAQDFERTFGHRLHAQFFCAHEDERFKAFIGRAGKTEQFYPRA